MPDVLVPPMKQGDLEPPVAVTLIDDTGTPVDLTELSVTFRLSTADHVELFERDAVIDGPIDGNALYEWQAGDTAVAGNYLAEFVIHWPAARPQTFPPRGYLVIPIEIKL